MEIPDNGKVITAVFVTLFLDTVSFAIILPLFPSLIDHYELANDKSYDTLNVWLNGFRDFLQIPDTRKYNAVIFGGALSSLFCLLQFLSSPILGRLSDKYGRRPLLMTTICGLIVSSSIWSVSRSFNWFVVTRMISGASKGHVTICMATVGDVSDRKLVNRGMATIGVAFSLGYIVGPIIGAYFARPLETGDEVGAFWITPALIIIALSTINIVYVYLQFPETHPITRTKDPLKLDTLPLPWNIFAPPIISQLSANYKTGFSLDRRRLSPIGFVYFWYILVFSGMEFTLVFLNHQRFGFTSMEQGRTLFFTGLLMAGLQGGVARRLKPGTEKKVTMFSLFAAVPAFLMIGFSATKSGLYAGLALYSVPAAFVVSSLSTLACGRQWSSTEKTPSLSAPRGAIMGWLRSLGALGRTVGPLLASLIYWWAGPQVCYAAGGLLMMVPILVLWRSPSFDTDRR